jgi:hypothetical protein
MTATLTKSALPPFVVVGCESAKCQRLPALVRSALGCPDPVGGRLSFVSDQVIRRIEKCLHKKKARVVARALSQTV